MIPKLLCKELRCNNVPTRLLSSGRVKDTSTEKTPVTSALWNQRFSKFGKSSDININTNNNVEYPTVIKSSHDSIRGMKYHFSTDPNLRDLYIDNLG